MFLFCLCTHVEKTKSLPREGTYVDTQYSAEIKRGHLESQSSEERCFFQTTSFGVHAALKEALSKNEGMVVETLDFGFLNLYRVFGSQIKLLDGGFKYFLLSPLPGEMIQFE